MKERTIDILTAVFLIAFSLVMRSQLEGIPREGVLFPLCVLYLIMYVSFNICMAVGIFTMLIVLTPKKTGKALLANLVFTAAFIVFFQVFFTNIMHIYFPEPFFG